MSTEDILTLYTQETKRYIWRARSLETTRNIASFFLGLMIIATYTVPAASSHYVLFFGSLSMFTLMVFDTITQRVTRITEERISLIEKNYFAPMLDKSMEPTKDWRERLAQSYFTTNGGIGVLEAFAMRIRDCYLFIFLALDSSWISKLYLFPAEPQSFGEFVHRLDFGPFPGWTILAFMAFFWSAFVVLLIWLRGKAQGLDVPR